jgi:hypothetical protein
VHPVGARYVLLTVHNTTHRDSLHLIDALGHILFGVVHPMGREGWTVPWYLALALAWGFGCNPRRWFGNDLTAGESNIELLIRVVFTRFFQTLSRLHVCATLAFAQVIGSICVMVARATAPNRVGPGSVFPDAAKWDFEGDFSSCLRGVFRHLTIIIVGGLKGSPMASAPFWVAM